MKLLKKIRSFRETAFSIVLFFGILFMLSQTWSIPALSGSADNMGPAFFPKIVFSIMLCLSIMLIVASFKKERLAFQDQPVSKQIPPKERFPESSERLKEQEALKRGAVAVLGLVGFLLLMEVLGFIITASLYLFSQIYLLAPQDKKYPLKYAIVSVLFIIVTYFIFKCRLYIMLPKGILG